MSGQFPTNLHCLMIISTTLRWQELSQIVIEASREGHETVSQCFEQTTTGYDKWRVTPFWQSPLWRPLLTFAVLPLLLIGMQLGIIREHSNLQDTEQWGAWTIYHPDVRSIVVITFRSLFCSLCFGWKHKQHNGWVYLRFFVNFGPCEDVWKCLVAQSCSPISTSVFSRGHQRRVSGLAPPPTSASSGPAHPFSKICHQTLSLRELWTWPSQAVTRI